LNTSTQVAALTQIRSYDNRGHLLTENDAASNLVATPATGSVGSIIISGAEQTKTIASVSGTPGTGSIYLSISSSYGYYPWSGSVQVTINGVTATYSFYNQTQTVSSIASGVANSINTSGAPVTAYASGPFVYITAKTTGTITNYSMSSSGSPFGAITPQISPLQGGTNGTPSSTIYDAGTLSATINGNITTVSWGNSGTSSSTIASALAAAIMSADSIFISASASGGVVSLASTGTGPTTNYNITTSITYDTTDFSSSSFIVGDSGMTGGYAATFQNAAYSYSIGGYDGIGNLKSVIDSVTGTWNYNYDTLSRVSSGRASSGYYNGSTISWAYDQYGNRLSETQGGTPSVPMPTSSTASYNAQNQVQASSLNSGAAFGYGGTGNILSDGTNQYLYDIEGRLCAVKNLMFGTITGYVYDAEGVRVAKGTLSSWPTACSAPTLANGFTLTASYVLGLGGEQVSEVNGSNSWTHTNIFADGKLLATYSGGYTNFDLNDWLGTKRVEVGTNGCHSNYLSLVFGNGLQPTSDGNCPVDGTEHHFTGKERDTEAGNDYFGARYYSSSMGRFMSPDWSAKEDPVPYAKLDDPQSLNLYAYVMNNPLSRIDPDGHACGDAYGAPVHCTIDAKAEGAPQKAQQQNSGSAIRAAMSPVVEDFSQMGSFGGDSQGNYDHYSYVISTGSLYKESADPDAGEPDTTYVGSGYSGKGAGLNNPDMQSEPGAKGKSDAGPIPVGSYTVGKMFDYVGKTGPGSMRLTPSALNDMLGRAGFLMHGDNSRHNFSASEGCIIMPKGVRDAVSNSGIHGLEVSAW
jgi:RHS repeat-associated protein